MDYGKYSSSPVLYNPTPGYMVTFSYTDSAGNTYSMPDYFAVPATVNIYITSNSYSITTRQVSFPLQTNLTLFLVQPSSEALLSQFKVGYQSYNPVGYLFQVPVCTLSSNPYGGASGTNSIFSCVAVTYGAISIVVWFYLPTKTSFGGIIGSINKPYPVLSWTFNYPLVVQGNGVLSAVDTWAGISVSTTSALSPGWHMAVVEEWASSTSGPYYLALYLDGNLVGQASTSDLPAIFGKNGPFNYGYIGGAYYGSPRQWFIFNGTIAFVAIYNTVLNSSQVQQLYSVGFPNTLFSNNLVVAYVLSNTTYYVFDGVSHFYIKPYFANQQILSQLGISNASLITITPTGQVGWVPFTQWQPVTNYSVISYCKLMNYYTFNYLGGSEYQVVLVTNQNMNQFPLKYKFLITSGSGSQYVLPVLATCAVFTFHFLTSRNTPLPSLS